QDTETQGKLERELRLREGALKLLGACSRPEQALEAAKGLQLASARALAYMGELQRRKEAQLLHRTPDASPGEERRPCLGTVCISDLRIPLMWKDTEYFRNKGELHRCAVFCLLQLGAEIHDTPLVLVDRTLTDICFETPIIFRDASPCFELKLELYSAGLCPGGSQGSAPRRLATRLSSSLGRSAGRRVRAALDAGTASPPPGAGTGPRFHLLAHATLSLAQVQDGFRTHDLALASSEDSSCWVPLYGSLCCRLVAQPRCMGTPTCRGHLRLTMGSKMRTRAEDGNGVGDWDGDRRGTRIGTMIETETGWGWGTLRDRNGMAMGLDSGVHLMERPHGVALCNRLGGEEVTHTLLAEGPGDARRWLDAFTQLRCDIRVPSDPPIPSPHAAIDPADDIEAVTDILTRRGGGRDPDPPPWLSLFEGPPPRALPRPGSPSPPPRRAWGRPRTLSLDA
ncbi:RTKN protein, partial [Rhinopomastus cyanomelas]|nr:RTKN protein [Rhinopomastus cyanomelas]